MKIEIQLREYRSNDDKMREVLCLSNDHEDTGEWCDMWVTTYRNGEHEDCEGAMEVYIPDLIKALNALWTSED